MRIDNTCGGPVSAPAATGEARPAGAEGTSHDQRLEQLIDRLPQGLQTPTRWLRRPSSYWVRVPAGILLVGGGFLSVLPFFGVWMLPVGLMLLAEDLPPLRRARGRTLDWVARRRPHWLGKRGVSEEAGTPRSSQSCNSHQ